MIKVLKVVITLLAITQLSSCDNENKLAKISGETNVGSANPQQKVRGIDQESLLKLAASLDIKYKFLSNIETDCPDKAGKKIAYCYAAELILTNPDNAIYNNWQLNFSQVYPTYASSSETLELKHINGDIHQITPQKNFAGFKAEHAHTIKLWVSSTLLSESELMPNYWLSSEQGSAKKLKPAVVTSTRTAIDVETGLEIQPWVVPFNNTYKQIKSAPNDINQYASPQWLYQQNSGLTAIKSHLATAIIPTPQSVKVVESGQLDISKGVTLHLTNIEQKKISAAQQRLTLLGIDFVENGVPININIDSDFSTIAGSYQLVIEKEGIAIDASDSSGAFYGLQSLASLLTVDDFSLPLVEITDQPRYQYRGQHLDVARNFHSKSMVFALIKQMAAYKLNKLHLHLAEDEAWRLELPSLPELTDIGSRRCMDLSDEKCMQPQLGSADNSKLDGFYSAADYQQILKMASRHHIQVIPSLDMPGHSRAAIKAMEARYRYFSKQENMTEATRYLLSDFDDKTQYSSIQNYNDNTLNICMESTYRFVDRVLEDLIALHQQADHPLAMYHIGADETAGAWVNSPVCKALIADKANEVNDVKHLGAHFIERVSHMVSSKGIAVGGWNDGLGETHVERMPKEVYSYIWGALPWGAHQQVSEQARRGWHVVLAIPDVLYFDFPYEIDPKERGYNWASRRVNSRSIFNFMPDNLPIHAEFRVDTLGQNFVSDDRVQQDDSGKLTHQPLPKNFIVDGVQGQLWSETVRSDQQAEYMIFPRMLTLAERAWHKPQWQVPYNYTGALFDKNSAKFTVELKKQREQQWQQFSSTLVLKELAKLDKAGIFYRLPTIGAKVEQGKLFANSSLLGLPIEYRELGGQWQAYHQIVNVKSPVEVRAKSMDGMRVGRSLVVK